jgi:hypothetical protein
MTNALSLRDEDPITVHAPSLPEFELTDQFCQESLSLPEIIAKQAKIEAHQADKAWSMIDGIVVDNGLHLLAIVFSPVVGGR